MEIETLTKNQIYSMHEIAFDNFGGNPAQDECTEGKIESILSQQYDFFGYEKYPSVFDKAAMLLYFLSKDHCFKDCNKRVALYATVTFLDMNGYEPTFNNEEAEQFVYKIAESQIKDLKRDNYIKSIAEIISENVQALDE